MKVGSIVETVANFEEFRALYHFPYPKMGDVLTVRGIEPHPAYPDLCVLLYFDELPSDMIGLCDKNIEEDKPNFVELRLPEEVKQILEEEEATV